MGHAALLLSVAALLLGLWPLWPQSQALGVVVSALGVLPGLGAMMLGLSSRSRALRENRPLGIYTAALGLSVTATLLCGVWLLAILIFMIKHRLS